MGRLAQRVVRYGMVLYCITVLLKVWCSMVWYGMVDLIYLIGVRLVEVWYGAVCEGRPGDRLQHSPPLHRIACCPVNTPQQNCHPICHPAVHAFATYFTLSRDQVSSCSQPRSRPLSDSAQTSKRLFPFAFQTQFTTEDR